MWKTQSRLAVALLVSASAACSDTTPTAPAAPAILVARDGATNTDVATNNDGARQVRYDALCTVKLREIGTPAVDARGYSRAQVEGLGECQANPFGTASVKLQGFMRERAEELTIEGSLMYRFADGSQLFSRATIGKREIGIFTQASMYFMQNFTRGTGRLAGVRGGSLYGSGTMSEPGYRATYFDQGSVTFRNSATQD